MQVVGLVLCIVIPLIGWALLARQVGRFVTLYRLGQPDAGRTGAPLTRSWVLTKEFLGHTRMSRLKVVAAAHWFTALSFIILFATLVNAFFQLVQPDYRLPLIGFFPPFEWLVEVFAWGGFIGIVVLVADPAEEPPALGGRCGWARLALLRLDVLAGLLRRGDDLLRHDLHPAAARARGGLRHEARAGGVARGALPAHRLDGGLLVVDVAADDRELGLRRRDGQDPHLVRVDDHHLAAADDGRGLAPLPRRSPTSGSSARPRGAPRSARRKPLTDRRQAVRHGRHGGARGGRHARRGRGRGLHLEGPARLLDVHRVRPLPVAVPRLEHREAAVPQAADDDAARPRRREGPVPAGAGPPRRRRREGDGHGGGAHGIPGRDARAGR